MRGGAGLLAVAAVAAAVLPAGAQVALSGGGLVCPPGLTAVPVGNGSSYRCAKDVPQPAPSPSAPAPGSAPSEDESSSDKAAAGGTQGRKASGGAACARFNAEFTPFYEESEARYAEAGEKQLDVSDRLRGLIADGRQLSKRLRAQAMTASFQIRAMLLQQARSVDEDVAVKQRMLSRLDKSAEKERAEWRKGYKTQFQEFLKKRPAGCKVEALAEEK